MVIGDKQIIRRSEHTNSNVFVFKDSEQSFSCSYLSLLGGTTPDFKLKSLIMAQIERWRQA
jgi:hypothetical protein